MPQKPPSTGTRCQGRAVPLARATKDAASPWNVLAYEVELRTREATLTKRDFEDAVKNFDRYGEVPVVLYHADLDAKANPESRKAHAWIEALRVGSMERNGKTVATLEGRFRWVNASTKSDVETGALKFGSVTIFQDALDEETGDDIGTLLYSFSLTNNPALVDLPALAAARLAGDGTALGYWYGDLDTRDDLVSCLRSIFELPVTSSEADVLAALDKLEALASSDDDAAKEAVCTLRRSLRLPLLTSVEDVIAEVRKGLSSLPSESTDTPSVDLSRGGFPAEENPPMALKLIALAAALGVVARDEDDAASQMNALATEAVDVRRALGSKTAAETAAKLSELSANAAKVPALEGKLATAQADALEREKAARDAHLTALCKARPELEGVRPSLELHARQDFAGFAAAYPIPEGNPETIALQAQLQKTQQLARGTQIAPPAGTPAPAPSAVQMPVNHAALARTLAAELMKNDPKLSERDALLLASKSVKNAENAAGKQ